MSSCPKVEVMYWNASRVRIKCPYCDKAHWHSHPLPGWRSSDCFPSGQYEIFYPIDEESGLVGYEIDKKRARFVNVKYVEECEKEIGRKKYYSLAEHFRTLSLNGSENTRLWKSHEDATELYTDQEGPDGRPFTQKMMPLAKSDCLFGEVIATEHYLKTTKEKELFIRGRDEDSNWETMLIMKARDSQPGMVALLIRHGAEVNAVNCRGRNSLMEAALWGRLQNVKILLRAGADSQAKDHENRSAFDLAQPTQVNEEERYDQCQFLAVDKVPEWDQCRRHISILLDVEEPAEPKYTAPLSDEERSVYHFIKSAPNLTITLQGPITKFDVQRISKTVAILDRGGHYPRIAATSGWANDALPVNIEDRPPWMDQVFTVASMVGHRLPAHSYDHGVPGRYQASHSEKKLIAYFIEKHVFTPQDRLYNKALQESLDEVADVLERTKTTSEAWRTMCTLEEARSALEWTLIDAQDELYETEDEIEKIQRENQIHEMRVELQQMGKEIRALEAEADVVKMRCEQDRQHLLEERQRLEEQLMGLHKHCPPLSLKHAVIWSSTQVCEDCESFKEAVNNTFGLDIQLTLR